MPEDKKNELKIKRSPVNSSNIVSVGYDEKSKTLDVEFYSGTMYRYTDVPPIIHERMVSTDSVGSFFARFVKKAFPYKKIG